MLPLGSGRSSLMSTGQGMTVQKPLARPSSLSSAIGRYSNYNNCVILNS